MGLPLRAQEMSAKIQGFLVTAKDGFWDTENDMVELSNGAQLIYKDQSISCQSAKINLRAKKIEAKGHVRITNAQTIIGGEHIILDYENGTGVIYNGFVQSGNVLFEGEILQKVSDTEYYVVRADYTACTNCPASWQFSGTSIRAELGGYAYIKNSIIRSGPVPILWLPYIVVPLKSDRQSGLLTPEFERTDSGGVALGESFFWAISRNTDATFGLKNYELRGLKTLFEYRYVLDENSQGQLNYATITDKVFKDEDRFNMFRATDAEKRVAMTRWFLKYDHFQELPNGFTHRVQLNNASDLQYSRDFFKETQNHGDPAMENRMSITKNTADQHYSLDSSYYINMMHADPLASNEDAVHRLPALRFSQTPKPIAETDFLYTVDLDYVNFARSGAAYDDLTAADKIRFPTNTSGSPNWEDKPTEKRTFDGYYNPSSDLIRTGQRLEIGPSIYRSFTFFNAIDVTPKLGYRETHYFFPNLPQKPGEQPVDSSNIRRYLRAEVATRTSFSQVYGPTSELRSTLWKHEIQPEVKYTRLPWIGFQQHPFFGFGQQTEAPYFTQNVISDEDTGSESGLQFDYNDRIYDRNLVTYSVTNRLVQKRWKNNEPEYRQVGLLRLSQSFDAFQDERAYTNKTEEARKQPWSDISGLLDVRFDNFEATSNTSYFPYQKVYNTNSRVRLIDDLGRFVQLGLISKYKIVQGEEADFTSQDYSFAAGLISRNLDFVGKMTFDALQKDSTEKVDFNRPGKLSQRVKSYSYIAQLKPPGDCLALRFVFEQVTGGDTNIGLQLQFSFDGKSPNPLSNADLDKIGI